MGREQMSNGLSQVAGVVGVGHSDWRGDHARLRAGEAARYDSVGLGAVAFVKALEDAGISRDEVDGLIVGPTTPYERMGEVLGIDARWGGQADAMLAVIQACMAIKAGLAEVVALVYGNNQRSAKVNYGGDNAAGCLEGHHESRIARALCKFAAGRSIAAVPPAQESDL